MPAPTPRAAKAIPAQGNSFVADFAGMGTVNGSTRVIEFRSQATISTWPTPPAGFAAMGAGSFPASDRSLARFAKYIADASTEPISYTIANVAGGGNSRIEAHIYIMDDVDPAHINDGGVKYNTTSGLPAGAALGLPYTIVAMVGAEYTAGNSCVPTTPTGFTPLLISQTAGGVTPVVLANSDTSGSRTGLATYYKKVESGTLTVDAIPFAWTSPVSTPTDPKAASWVVRGVAGSLPMGLPIARKDASTVYLSRIGGDGVRRPFLSLRRARGDLTVAGSLLIPGITMGHRGASLVSGMPEMSRRAYLYAARTRRYRMLEFSANRTGDATPTFVGIHDVDQNRTSQTTGLANVAARTLAQIQTAPNSLNAAGDPVPYFELSKFLIEFAGEQVLHIDPKFNTGGITAFLDALEPFKAFVVLKYVGVGVGPDALAIAAKARGFTTATYAYEADWSSGALHASQQYWDILGMQYDASTAAWSRTTEGAYPGIRSYGKPVLAHILQTQAQYDIAKAKIEEGGWVNPGAGRSWIAQVSGVNVVAAVS